MAHLALNTGLGGWDRVAAFTPPQVYWLYGQSMQAKAAERSYSIDDLSAVIGSAFSDGKSDAAKGARAHIKMLRQLAGLLATRG